jgi:hypothetical protein
MTAGKAVSIGSKTLEAVPAGNATSITWLAELFKPPNGRPAIVVPSARI